MTTSRRPPGGTSPGCWRSRSSRWRWSSCAATGPGCTPPGGSGRRCDHEPAGRPPQPAVPVGTAARAGPAAARRQGRADAPRGRGRPGGVRLRGSTAPRTGRLRGEPLAQRARRPWKAPFNAGHRALPGRRSSRPRSTRSRRRWTPARARTSARCGSTWRSPTRRSGTPPRRPTTSRPPVTPGPRAARCWRPATARRTPAAARSSPRWAATVDARLADKLRRPAAGAADSRRRRRRTSSSWTPSSRRSRSRSRSATSRPGRGARRTRTSRTTRSRSGSEDYQW